MVENSEKNVLIKKIKRRVFFASVLKVQKKYEYSQVGVTTYESVIYCQTKKITVDFAKSILWNGNLFFTRSRQNRARKQPIATKIRITLTKTESHGRANANMRAKTRRIARKNVDNCHVPLF